MKYISQEQPPSDTNPALSAYLMRLVSDINEAIKQIHEYELNAVLPAKMAEGNVMYFSQPILLTPIIAKGWWGYNGTTWVQLG